MSGISSVGLAGANRFGGVQVGHYEDPARQIEKELTSFLNTKGVSAEDQAAIKTDLQNALESSVGGGRPDLSKIKDAFNEVLGKRGLDGNEFVQKLPQPPGGSKGQGAAGGTGEYDYLKSLLDFLAEPSEKTAKQNAAKRTESKASSESTWEVDDNRFDVRA